MNECQKKSFKYSLLGIVIITMSCESLEFKIYSAYSFTDYVITCIFIIYFVFKNHEIYINFTALKTLSLIKYSSSTKK